MTDKAKIEKLVLEHIQGSGLFLVAVRISAAGKITILVDRKERVTIEECAELSKFIDSNLDRDVEDYELQVSSPGLDMPFIVIEQYYKNEGQLVEVLSTDGRKYKGILKNVTDGGFELETVLKEKSGSRGKTAETKDISFNFEQVKSAHEIVTFK